MFVYFYISMWYTESLSIMEFANLSNADPFLASWAILNSNSDSFFFAVYLEEKGLSVNKDALGLWVYNNLFSIEREASQFFSFFFFFFKE